MAGEIFVQLVVDFPDDDKVRALARYGRHARGCRDLIVMMILYCRGQLTDGYVPPEQIGILVYPDPPRVGHADVRRLIEVGLVEQCGEGYLVRGFLKRNPTRAKVESDMASRAAGAAATNHRRWHVELGKRIASCALCVGDDPGTGGNDPGVAPAISPPVDPPIGGSVTETETETELSTRRSYVRTAAARNVRAGDHEKTPPPSQPETTALGPLRTELDAAGLGVRWDKLGGLQRAEIVRLAAVHGVPALVEVAKANYRAGDPPVYAQAWLAAWRDLPPPQQRLRAVACGRHGLPEPCRSCAADALAGEAS